MWQRCCYTRNVVFHHSTSYSAQCGIILHTFANFKLLRTGTWWCCTYFSVISLLGDMCLLVLISVVWDELTLWLGTYEVVFMKCHNTWTLPKGYICHSVTIGKGLHHIQIVTTDWLILPHLANFEDFAYYGITECGIITRLFGRLGVTRHHKNK